jgi:peptidoglycan biosynthesis protein MviN/MurJ (putative lipid II flippase)
VILNASLNIMAVFLLPEAWRHVGLALSTVVCALVGVVVLVVIAKIKAGRIGLSQSIKPSIKALIGAIIMAFAVMVTKEFFSGAFLNEDFSIEKIIALAVEILVGIMVYGVYSVVLMRERISSFIRKRLNK